MKNVIIVIISFIIVLPSLILVPTSLAAQNWNLFFTHLFIIALIVYGNMRYFKKQKKTDNKNTNKDSNPSLNN